MTTTTKATELGRTIGQAIARDVLADSDMSREWTGLDEQDGHQLLAAGIDADTPEWAEAERAAEAAYRAVLDGTTHYRLYTANRNAGGGLDPTGTDWEYRYAATAQEAANEYAEELSAIEDCKGLVVVATDDDGDSAESVVD